jgi:hypothetical protein
VNFRADRRREWLNRQRFDAHLAGMVLRRCRQRAAAGSQRRAPHSSSDSRVRRFPHESTGLKNSV